MACYWIDDCDNIFLFSESIDSVILWAGFLLAFADICASCWCSVNAERDIPFVQVNCTDTFRSIYALLAMSVGLLAKWVGFGVNAVYLPIVLFFFFWDARPKKSKQYFFVSLVLTISPPRTGYSCGSSLPSATPFSETLPSLFRRIFQLNQYVDQRYNPRRSALSRCLFFIVSV